MADAQKIQASSSGVTVDRPSLEKRQVPTSNTSLETKLLASSKAGGFKQDDRLTRLYKRENEIFGDARGVLEHLKSIVVRVKTDGVKEDVDKLVALFESLVYTRKDIRMEYRTVMAVAEERSSSRPDSIATDARTIDRLAASEDKILGAIGAMNERLDTHEKIISRMSVKTDNVECQVAISVTPVSS